MTKEFVTYEQALALKELGFDEPCMASRDMNNDEGLIQIPLKQQAFRWFREKHGLGHMINGIGYEAFCMGVGGVSAYFSPFKFNTYEEAEQACLDKLIEICKNK